MLKLKVDQKSGRWKKEKKKIMRSVFLTKIGLSIYIFSGASRRQTTSDPPTRPYSLKIPLSLDYKISLDYIYKNDIL